jgi:hypothetical protein
MSGRRAATQIACVGIVVLDQRLQIGGRDQFDVGPLAVKRAALVVGALQGSAKNVKIPFPPSHLSMRILPSESSPGN